MEFNYKNNKITYKNNKIVISTKDKKTYEALTKNGFETFLIDTVQNFLNDNSEITLISNKRKLENKLIKTIGLCFSKEKLNNSYLYKFTLEQLRSYFTLKTTEELDLGSFYLLKGKIIKDNYYNRNLSNLENNLAYEEFTFEASEINKIELEDEVEIEERPRYELHLHTNKSQRDAFITNEELLDYFEKGYLDVVAITDHGMPNSFPESIKSFSKSKYKVVPAIELYVVDDEKLERSKLNWKETNDFIFEKINSIQEEIESKNELLELYSNEIEELSNRKKELTEESKNTDDKSSKKILTEEKKIITEKLKERKLKLSEIKNSIKGLNKELKEVELKKIELLKTEPVLGDATRFHVSIFVKSKDERYIDEANGYEFDYNPGIYELNKAITKSFTETYGKTVLNSKLGNRNIVTLSDLKKLKETNYFHISGACSLGMISNYIIEKKEYIADEYISLFDSIEIQPLSNNYYLLDSPDYPEYKELKDLIDLNHRIYLYGKKHNVDVIFTSDAHVIDYKSRYKRAMFKKCYMSMLSAKYRDGDFEKILHDSREETQPYLRKYSEMVKELKMQGFSDEVIEELYQNEKKIAESLSYFNNITVIPKQMFVPDAPGITDIKNKIKTISQKNAERMYGVPLHKEIQERLDSEIEQVCNAGYGYCYYMSLLMVQESEKLGYPVGSRGSVGSSLLALFMGITENNALPPHYYCDCGYLEWRDDVKNGLDLPNQNCPNCGKRLNKNGFDGNISSFLGGNPKKPKTPDID